MNNCNVNDNGFISNNDGLATKLDLAKLQMLINRLREDLDNGFETFPISTIIPYAGNGNIPSGFLLCDGSSISRKEYTALYKCIGDLYGSEDDEHFNLPDLRDKFVKGGYVAGSQKTVDTNGTSPVLTMRYIIKAEEAGGNIDDIKRFVEEWLASHAAMISGKGSVWTYDKELGGFRPKTMDEISSADVDSSDETVMHLINRMAFPPGSIIPFAGNGDIPVGFLLCNGASVLRETYPDLFDVIGTTYGSEDDLHFNLPDLSDRFIEGSDVAGDVKEAGLPNIDGSVTGVRVSKEYGSSSFGPFTFEGKTDPKKYVGSSEGGSMDIHFDASRANPIYGNSTTVQPNSVTMRYIIKAFGCANNTGDVEITQIANELNEFKSSVKDYVVESYSDGNGNWYRKYKSGWLEQGGVLPVLTKVATKVVSLLKPFATNKYTVLTQNYHNGDTINVNTHFSDNGFSICRFSVFNFTATSFNVYYGHSTKDGLEQRIWYACGQGAEE